jgi:ligand-binding sensor domain-containing protein
MKHLPKIYLCFYFILISGLSFAQVEKIEIPKGLYVFTVQEDLSGTIWVGLSDGISSGGLGNVDANRVISLSLEDGAPGGSYHNSIKLPDGSLLFAGNITSREGKSFLVWLSTTGADTITIPFRLNNPFVSCITLVNRRDIWIGTASGLLVNRRGEWEFLSVKDGLPDNFITAIYQDFRGVVWVGTEKGIASYIDGKFFAYKQGTRVINSVTHLFSDNRGYLWCGSRFSSEGVSVYNGEVWQTFSGPHGLADNSSSIFHQDNSGTLWIGSCYNKSRGGLTSYDGKKWSSYSSPKFIAKTCVDAIITDKHGRTWFGGSLTGRRGKGITILDNNEWHKVGGNSTFPAERVIIFFLDSKGNLWISSFEGFFKVSPDFLP